MKKYPRFTCWKGENVSMPQIWVQDKCLLVGICDITTYMELNRRPVCNFRWVWTLLLHFYNLRNCICCLVHSGKTVYFLVISLAFACEWVSTSVSFHTQNFILLQEIAQKSGCRVMAACSRTSLGGGDLHFLPKLFFTCFVLPLPANPHSHLTGPQLVGATRDVKAKWIA